MQGVGGSPNSSLQALSREALSVTAVPEDMPALSSDKPASRVSQTSGHNLGKAGHTAGTP